LIKIGEIPDDEPSEAEGQGADEPGPETVTAEANGLVALNPQAATSPEFFIGIDRNPLKSPDSKK
jgi:hypothetical protein